MYLLSQNKAVSVNSTTLSSISIEKAVFVNKEFEEKFPEAHAILAFGKGDKTYIMGIYTNKERAEREMERLHDAMSEKEPTYSF